MYIDVYYLFFIHEFVRIICTFSGVGPIFFFYFFFFFHIDIVYECIVLRCIVNNKLTYLLT